MGIRFRCQSCGQELSVPDSAAGKRGKCPRCKQAVRVPSASATTILEPFAAAEETPARVAPEPASARTALASAPTVIVEPAAEGGAAATLGAPPFEAAQGVLAGAWALQLVALLIMALALGVIALRGRTVVGLCSSVEGKLIRQQAPAFTQVSTFGCAALAVAGLVLLVGGGGALRRSERGRQLLVGGIPVYVALQAIYAGLLNVPALYPPGPNNGLDLRLLEGVFLVASLIVCAPCWLYLWRVAPRFMAAAEEGAVDIIHLVHQLLSQALHSRASDVHFEPTSDGVTVRYRIDGVLHPVVTYPPQALERIVSRIKVMGRMNIAERRLPQDGSATLAVGNKGIDLRISTVPSNYGERAVLRLLDPATGVYGLQGLGMDPDLLPRMDNVMERPHGVFFCTGPTGSGKTTTLYAALLRVNTSERNVITVEDPIEYRLTGISQLPVGRQKGMTFASGLRSILRQDPDVIMVGEVRDGETASMVIRAAQTGHLVISTLHTNDSAGAVARLLDLGVEPFLLASSLTAVLAQRLVRCICPDCSEAYEPTQEEVEELGATFEPGMAFHRGRGCPRCLNTGYYGRVGLFELLMVGDQVRRLINERADAWTVRKAALTLGMVPLDQDGARKVIAGVTTVAEVRRVTTGSLQV